MDKLMDTVKVVPSKLIIDVDTGCDDAQALMFALSLPQVQVIAITCVAGNTKVNQVAVNTLRVLQLFHRLDIPVYVGANSPLLASEESFTCEHYGSDGLGDMPCDNEIATSLIQKEPAAVAMVKLAAAYPGEITLLALAPLTNLALAIKLDSNIGKMLKNVVVMGGSLNASGNCGRVDSLTADFNFGMDPEATDIVLSQLGMGAERFQLVPLETCNNSNIDWEWCDKVLMSVNTTKGQFHRSMWTKTLPVKRASNRHFYSCDFSAAVVAILNDQVVTEQVRRHCAVELRGTFTRGHLAVDSGVSAAPNVLLVTALDFDVIKRCLLHMLQ